MEPILGIDLGTTNSAAAVYRDGKVEMIEHEGQTILPSVVGLDEGGQLLVGTPARNQYVLAPERTIRSIKRRMGQEVTVSLGDAHYTPQEISAIILRTLKERAEQQLGQEIRKAVITVPAFFKDDQREATREAGQLAGLEVVRIINEPTAASLSYEANTEAQENLLVYDLGGGTFDVSAVQVEHGVIEVLASHGDTQLGGDDFDQLLLDAVCDQFQQEHGIDPRQSPVARSRLLHAVEEAKKTLSVEPVAQLQEEFLVEKDGTPIHLDRELSRFEYEELIEPLVQKTLGCLDAALQDARLQASQIDYVVLVGGASRTPLVHEVLEKRLRQPLHMEVDPDLCVAMGAAIQGALISGIDAGPVLVDITPHTLGIQARGMLYGFVSDNCFSPIIPRNSPLPVCRSQMYSTSYDGQDMAHIAVYQGEEPDVRHNKLVGEFMLEGLADVEAGNEIQVRFHLDLNGILSVTATERMTGLEKQVVIENSIERFRRQGREAAEQRLKDVFHTRTELARAPAPAESAVAVAQEQPMDGELQQVVRQAEHLIVRGERLLADAAEEDAAELQQLIHELRKAIERRSVTEIKKHLSPLDDIVFYLQDA